MSLPREMKGAMLLGPGTIEVRTLPVPRPAAHEILLKVDAATTCGTDVKVFLRGGHPRMLKAPTLFGHEMAGTVVARGAGVDRFAPGDRLVVANSAPCGRCPPCRSARENLCQDLHYLNGAFAEYLLVPERFVARSLHRIPDRLSAERAALSEPLACVLHGVEACAEALARPADALVLGAGPIGLMFACCLERAEHRTTLADPNPTRLEAARAMGIARALEVPRERSQRERDAIEAALPEGVDLVVDCTGSPAAWPGAVRAARAGGLVCLFGGLAPGTQIELDAHRLHYGELTVKGVYHHRPQTFRRALELLADPSFSADVLLGARYPIDDVASALEAMMSRRVLKAVIAGTRRAPNG